jgi:hypothetical protein
MNGIKAVLSGKKIDSGNPQDFAFSSLDTPLSVPLLGLSLEGTTDYVFTTNPATPGSGNTVVPLFTFQHDLGYVPVSLVYVFIGFAGNSANSITRDQSYYLTPCPLFNGDFSTQSINYYVDNSKLVIYYEIESGGFSYGDVTGMDFTFKYYLFSNVLE